MRLVGPLLLIAILATLVSASAFEEVDWSGQVPLACQESCHDLDELIQFHLANKPLVRKEKVSSCLRCHVSPELLADCMTWHLADRGMLDENWTSLIANHTAGLKLNVNMTQLIEEWKKRLPEKLPEERTILDEPWVRNLGLSALIALATVGTAFSVKRVWRRKG